MKKIWLIFDNSSRIKFFILSVLITINILLETISISLLLPIIVSLTDNNLFELYPKIALFINFFEEKFSTSMINATLILFGVTIVFKNLFQTYINYKEANLNISVAELTSQRLFNSFLSRNYSFHLKNNSYDLITKIRNETKYFSEAVFSVITILSDSILVLGIGILLLILSFKLTLIIIIFSFLFSYIFIKIFNNFIKKASLKRQEIEFKKTNILQESIQGIREIILSNINKSVLDGYESISNTLIKYFTLYVTLQKIPKVYFEFIILLALVIVVFVSSNFFELNKTQIILPTIGLYAASAFKILPAINRIVIYIQRYKFSFPAVNSVYDELKEKKEITIPPKIFNIKDIYLKDISFSYSNPAKIILKNLSLKIRSGEKILIIGESGVGKSTLLDILVGLQKPDDGKIIINDNILLKEKENLTNSLSYVSQKLFLFNKSLKFNITLSDEKFEKTKFENAIKVSNLSNLVSKLKEGYNTQLGEFGGILSGGQKQRVMIARALYKSDNFVILDEPTSSLDFEMSNSIIKEIMNKDDLTLIMVSHNKEFQKFFKKVYMIENFNIVEAK